MASLLEDDMVADSIWKLAYRCMPGVSWQNPVVNGALHLLDPLDAVVRIWRGSSDLPPYSTRVRSNGLRGQFGGETFSRRGEDFVRILCEHANLRPDSRVLEIGCGCGRIAIPLAHFLRGGNYVGVDVDAPAIRACERNRAFHGKRFDFELLAVQNDEYNPHGGDAADSFRFPFPDASFDVVFLVSVFTNMLPDAIGNYALEIGRLLAAGGRCALTAFLMDFGSAGVRRDFSYDCGSYRSIHPTLPEKSVGYHSSFFDQCFA